jgi:hypothetical protein
MSPWFRRVESNQTKRFPITPSGTWPWPPPPRDRFRRFVPRRTGPVRDVPSRDAESRQPDGNCRRKVGRVAGDEEPRRRSDPRLVETLRNAHVEEPYVSIRRTFERGLDSNGVRMLLRRNPESHRRAFFAYDFPQSMPSRSFTVARDKPFRPRREPISAEPSSQFAERRAIWSRGTRTSPGMTEGVPLRGRKYSARG